ncbi:MAG: hypothetical protein LBI87_01160 [Candidatus Accumulibacter sp.]|jgi:hypothetical protein|nr:hypothetical protein [Accumulibacter sp.]
MPLFDEKRKSLDRRVWNDGPLPGNRERRSKKDRRQTQISEITFHEWALHLLRFKKYFATRAATRKKSEETKTRQKNDASVIHGMSTISF